MDATYQEIAEALAVYFDGFYEGDIDKLKRIFHPSAHLFSATDGPLADDPIEAVYARVSGRASPVDSGQQRMDRILSIDKSGAESALAKVQIAIGPKFFTDYLNLLKIDGRWQIISKIYTYVPLEEAQAAAAE
ncbi:MAG TPA: nuclear transport factor 2 family protein [Alphaproteobacteria bacterium]|jgi:4-oxalocrotonate tautomerase|nr:nuclear transport factor 2 family protein [Alphaproteobacteria bacterium]MDP6271252.1 nuclear transport factor 2 family protein [Alphaproteobacteria bacterium]MDP7427430.1 nuclear transport factor 2 family protein [Alphaproteobacteria bacterium]HJM51424.1 nuclear transport factor 2 family protein [Alphaproteobacteria bacterium]